MHESKIVSCPIGGASYAITDEEGKVFLIPPKTFVKAFDEYIVSDLVRVGGAEGVAKCHRDALKEHGWRAVIRLV